MRRAMEIIVVMATLFGACQSDAVAKRQQIHSWEDVVQFLFLNPRGDALEPREVLRLLELAQGKRVGPFDVDHLLSLHNPTDKSCDQQHFNQIDIAFEQSHEWAKTLTLYLDECLKLQVIACKYEFNFKRAVAKLDGELTREIERLADLIKEPQNLKLKVNSGEIPHIYDQQLIAEAVKHMVEHEVYDEVGETGIRLMLYRRSMDFIERLRSQCDFLRPLVEDDITGTLRYPDSIWEDRITMRWFKVLQICYSLEGQARMIDRVHQLMLNEENAEEDESRFKSLKKIIG